MKKNIKKLLICIYLLLLCCIFLSTALSKNTTKVEGKASTNVAGIRLNIITDTTNLSNLSNVQQNIQFTVCNYDGTEENPIYSDIEYNYQISISTAQNVPVEYELYKIENEQQTKVSLTEGISENFTMPHSQIREDSYILNVKLDDKTYKDIEDVLNIEVYAVQL